MCLNNACNKSERFSSYRTCVRTLRNTIWKLQKGKFRIVLVFVSSSAVSFISSFFNLWRHSFPCKRKKEKKWNREKYMRYSRMHEMLFCTVSFVCLHKFKKKNIAKELIFFDSEHKWLFPNNKLTLLIPKPNTVEVLHSSKILPTKLEYSLNICSEIPLLKKS